MSGSRVAGGNSADSGSEERATSDVGAEVIDPLALALFGVRDHIRHHHGCADRRGIGGHHYDADDECALRDIIERYADQCVEAAEAEALREAADDLLAFSRSTRDAWRGHNAGRDLGKQRQIRPDLNTWADATEAASHRIRNRAAALDGPRP